MNDEPYYGRRKTRKEKRLKRRYRIYKKGGKDRIKEKIK
jgi:hypothetical protein